MLYFRFLLAKTPTSASDLFLVAKSKARCKRLFDPHNAPDEIILQPSAPESVPDLLSRLSSNLVLLVQNCVGLSSRDTYSTAWRLWEKFCGLVGADTSLLVPFKEWSTMSSPFLYPVAMVAWFITYMQSKTPRILPGTVDNYISGLRHCLMQLNISKDIFKVQVIQQARAGLMIRHRIDNPEADSKTLPFLCSWFRTLRTVRSVNKMEDLMVIVALQLSFVCLLRASETVISPENHFLRACDVNFIVLVHGVEVWILPHEAHLYPLSDLIAISIKIRSAKNDEGGRGFRYYFTRNVSLQSTAAFDLVEDMFSLASLTKPQGTDSFFSYGDYVLKYHTFNDTIKKVAAAVGADQSRYSCHSMRVGGATVLAAARFPDYVIQNMGRWKSLEFLHYLHWNPTTMSEAITALVDPGIFTMSDLIKMNPAAEIVDVHGAQPPTGL